MNLTECEIAKSERWKSSTGGEAKVRLTRDVEQAKPLKTKGIYMSIGLLVKARSGLKERIFYVWNASENYTALRDKRTEREVERNPS
jgi:hypothetical protein